MDKLILLFIAIIFSGCVTLNTNLKEDPMFDVRERRDYLPLREGRDYLLQKDARQIQ